MIPKLIRLTKNPTVRKIAVWVGPIILGWFMKKLEEPTTSSSRSSRKSKKR